MTTTLASIKVRDRTPLSGASLLALAGVGWWWSVHSSGSMTAHSSMGMGGMSSMSTTMSLGSFFVAWVAMMAAMMFPAILPAVRLFERAADRGQTVATPIFVAGYLLVWSSIGVPVYFAWRALAGPLADGDHWAAYLAGGVFAGMVNNLLLLLHRRLHHHEARRDGERRGMDDEGLTA